MNKVLIYPPKQEMVCDHACLLTFADAIDEHVADVIAAVSQALNKAQGIIDLVPSYTTLLVVFDTDHFDRFKILKHLQSVVKAIDPSAVSTHDRRIVDIPVYYDTEVGPDLEAVAAHCGLSVAEVIQLHCSTLYRAFAIGFSPGFAFLGNIPEALRMPRKTTPRLKVPQGSVAIAEQQTAVYPGVSPGGWQLLGRTPVSLVDWQSDSLALIQVGDSVRFNAIDRAQFLALGGELDGL